MYDIACVPPLLISFTSTVSSASSFSVILPTWRADSHTYSVLCIHLLTSVTYHCSEPLPPHIMPAGLLPQPPYYMWFDLAHICAFYYYWHFSYLCCVWLGKRRRQTDGDVLPWIHPTQLYTSHPTAARMRAAKPIPI